MLPVRWDALKESNLAHTVYKGGLLAHPNKGVKSLAESLCKQWTDAAPAKKPRCVSVAPHVQYADINEEEHWQSINNNPRDTLHQFTFVCKACK